jgi:phosphohistidine phosphatase
MQTLILMRHAKAVRDSEAESDEARGLTDRGRQEARAAGAALRAANLQIDQALVSPALRTRETFAEAGLAADVVSFCTIDALYLADAEILWREAVDSRRPSVLILGHNPGLQELIVDLVKQSGDHSRLSLSLVEHLPTAAWAAFAIGGDLRTAASPLLITAWQGSAAKG